MLLWLIVGLGFLTCVGAWHLWQGITWEEAGALFIAAGIIFNIQLHYIYNQATTDHYLVSGYVTSLIHRTSFSYQCGKHTCSEPERWIIEQRPHQPRQLGTVTRPIHSGDGTETCYGECKVLYPSPYEEVECCAESYAYTMLVSPGKFARTKLRSPSVVWKSFYNPVQVSDDVVYDGVGSIPYFKTEDYNRAHRLMVPQMTVEEENNLEEINAKFSPQNISVGLIVTEDSLYFEKLKRAWHQGKSNDFVVVVHSPDGKGISNVNVLAWSNYALQENVIGAISVLPSANINSILAAIQTGIVQSPPFSVEDFSRYRFLSIKIPDIYYSKIIGFQALFFVYMLLLLQYNPNTKDKKLSGEQVLKMWDKHFSPPEKNWYLHPLTPSGLALYVGVPFLVAHIFF